MRRYIHIYIDYIIYRKFASLCKFLGINVCDTLERLLKQFIEQHKDQAPLDFYVEEAREVKINLNLTQNNYIILAQIARLDPQKWLNDLNSLDPDRLSQRETEFWKNKLSELILEANRLLEEIKLSGVTGVTDSEHLEALQTLITKASELLEKILKKKKTRRELIHA
jgi:hypothetical protein